MQTFFSLYKSHHKTAESIDISAIDPDTIPNIIGLENTRCHQDTHPVQSVISSTSSFEAPNTWDHSQQKIHQNPTRENTEKLIKLKNDNYFVITKPNNKNESHIYRYTPNKQSNTKKKVIFERIQAHHILAFEWNKKQELLVCVVLFESEIRLIKMHVGGESETVPILGLSRSETDIPTAKVFVVGEACYSLIESQKNFALIKNTNEEIFTLRHKNNSICPSISYQTDHALYIYYLEKSPEIQDQIDIKKMIIDSKAIKTSIFRNITVPEQEMECALSLSPSNLAFAFSIHTPLNTETCIISLKDDSKTRDVRYKFTPDFKPQIDWHPTRLMFAQHATSKRFTLISLHQQQNERGTGSFLWHRFEYSTRLRNLNQIFLFDDPISEIETCCYARTSSDKNDYLFRLTEQIN